MAVFVVYIAKAGYLCHVVLFVQVLKGHLSQTLKNPYL